MRLELPCQYRKAKPPLHRNTRKTARSAVPAEGDTKTGRSPSSQQPTLSTSTRSTSSAHFDSAFAAAPTLAALAVSAGVDPFQAVSADREVTAGASNTPYYRPSSSLSPASCAAPSAESARVPAPSSETGVAASLADATRERSSTFAPTASAAPSLAGTSQVVPTVRHPIDLRELEDLSLAQRGTN